MRAFEKVGPVRFPAAAGINVNMLPFVCGDIDSLPEECRPYWPLIEACGCPEPGEVNYLSVSEGSIYGHQRRPGLHTEGFGSISWGGTPWGGGYRGGAGLWMASTDGACQVYDALVMSREHGDCEGLQIDPALGDGERMAASTLYWLTDRTPHESLQSAGYRQWFRLVSKTVGIWFSRHSTMNPKVDPACPVTAVDKFRG